MLDDINILPLIRFLSPSNILAVFTSLLVERRIIFVADNLSTLSSCVQAAAAVRSFFRPPLLIPLIARLTVSLLQLLYPFSWQHIFIPVLPQSLLSFACAPMPYVIGTYPPPQRAKAKGASTHICRHRCAARFGHRAKEDVGRHGRDRGGGRRQQPVLRSSRAVRQAVLFYFSFLFRFFCFPP
jgi:hypothetical protein